MLAFSVSCTPEDVIFLTFRHPVGFYVETWPMEGGSYGLSTSRLSDLDQHEISPNLYRRVNSYFDDDNQGVREF